MIETVDILKDIEFIVQPEVEAKTLHYEFSLSDGGGTCVATSISQEFRETCEQLAIERGLTVEEIVAELAISQF